MLPTLERVTGKNNIRSMNWVTGAEDFLSLAIKCQASFLFWRNG
jgi:hypothetical protein